MSASDSTIPLSAEQVLLFWSKVNKPAKPYPDFPLTAHNTGRWCKKIRGRLVYFGLCGDPDGALAKYLEQKDALHAGRKPRSRTWRTPS